MDSNLKAKKFQNAVFHLLKTEPFYAHFVLNSTISFDTHNVPTAGAAVFKGIPYIIINSEFVRNFTPAGYAAVLKHEILHLLFEHTKKTKLDADQKHSWNIAMDCAINQYIADLPIEGVTLAGLSKAVDKELLPFQTSQYYYDFIKDKKEEMKNQQTLDDHDFAPEDADGPELAKEGVKQVAKKASRAAAGNISDALIKALDLLNEAKLPWRQILKNFILINTAKSSRNTRKKINRRFGLEVPGKIKIRTLKLGVCVDSSGSVDDSQFAAFMTEIKQIVNQGVEVVLVDADCEVKSVTKIKSKKDFKPKRSGAGGTAYQPAIDECMRQKCNVIVLFGDMDTADTPVNPKVPFLWVAVGESAPPADFGKVLRIS